MEATGSNNPDQVGPTAKTGCPEYCFSTSNYRIGGGGGGGKGDWKKKENHYT